MKKLWHCDGDFCNYTIETDEQAPECPQGCRNGYHGSANVPRDLVKGVKGARILRPKRVAVRNQEELVRDLRKVLADTLYDPNTPMGLLTLEAANHIESGDTWYCHECHYEVITAEKDPECPNKSCTGKMHGWSDYTRSHTAAGGG